ncbi:MAG: transglycosylase SLT domain-containing protein [Bacteroidota bacterium]
MNSSKHTFNPIHQLQTEQRQLMWIALLIATNAISFNWQPSAKAPRHEVAKVVEMPNPIPKPELYLMEEASRKIDDMQSFSHKVEDISSRLDIPSAWLMAVMQCESQFQVGVRNYMGSGATGLIQFMPSTAEELHTTTSALMAMSATQQLDYVYAYLSRVKARNGSYESLTDLYLAILYPKARKKDPCFTLYAQPSRAYQQNSGLDENKDGAVTVSDISSRLHRLHPIAFITK